MQRKRSRTADPRAPPVPPHGASHARRARRSSQPGPLLAAGPPASPVSVLADESIPTTGLADTAAAHDSAAPGAAFTFSTPEAPTTNDAEHGVGAGPSATASHPSPGSRLDRTIGRGPGSRSGSASAPASALTARSDTDSVVSALRLPSQPLSFRMTSKLLGVGEAVALASRLLPARYRAGAAVPPAFGGIGADAPGAAAPTLDLLGIIKHVGPVQTMHLPPWKGTGGGAAGNTSEMAELVLTDATGAILSVELHGTLARDWAAAGHALDSNPPPSAAAHCGPSIESASSEWHTRTTHGSARSPKPPEVDGESVPSAGEFTVGLLDTAPHCRRPAMVRSAPRPRVARAGAGLGAHRAGQHAHLLSPGDVVYIGNVVVRALRPRKENGRWVWDGIVAVARPARDPRDRSIAAAPNCAGVGPSRVELCHRPVNLTFDPALAQLDSRYAHVLALAQAAEHMAL